MSIITITLIIIALFLGLTSVFMFLVLKTLKNTQKLIKDGNVTRCCNSTELFMITMTLNRWEPIIEKMEKVCSIINPIVKRKYEHNQTVNANRDEIQVASENAVSK